MGCHAVAMVLAPTPPGVASRRVALGTLPTAADERQIHGERARGHVRCVEVAKSCGMVRRDYLPVQWSSRAGKVLALQLPLLGPCPPSCPCTRPAAIGCTPPAAIGCTPPAAIGCPRPVSQCPVCAGLDPTAGVAWLFAYAGAPLLQSRQPRCVGSCLEAVLQVC